MPYLWQNTTLRGGGLYRHGGPAWPRGLGMDAQEEGVVHDPHPRQESRVRPDLRHGQRKACGETEATVWKLSNDVDEEMDRNIDSEGNKCMGQEISKLFK